MKKESIFSNKTFLIVLSVIIAFVSWVVVSLDSNDTKGRTISGLSIYMDQVDDTISDFDVFCIISGLTVPMDRFATAKAKVKANKEIRIIVPGKTMNEVLRLLANDDEAEVHISANRRYIVFNTAGYTIMSRLIEGEFLNYKNVIPNGSRTQAVLDTKGFIETIERASLIITERLKNPLRITFTDGKVIVRCQTSLGRVMDEFAAACEGDEVEIGFNNRYLLDALRNARTEQVRVQLSGPLSPVKILPAEGDDFLYLVLPVRFRND